jgi:hypothetical protein
VSREWGRGPARANSIASQMLFSDPPTLSARIVVFGATPVFSPDAPLRATSPAQAVPCPS